MRRDAERAGRRAAGRVVAALALAGVGAIVIAAWRLGARADGAAGTRLGPEAAVTRGARRLAAIERVGRARGRGRLPLYLAPATGATIDSARVGALAARLVPGTESGNAPAIALVPRDSVRGLAPIGRLVVTPGEPGLLVYGARGYRP